MTNRSIHVGLAAGALAVLLALPTPVAAGKKNNGTQVNAPLTTVDTNAKGTQVNAPFTGVKTSRKGTWVRAPFVNLFVPRR